MHKHILSQFTYIGGLRLVLGNYNTPTSGGHDINLSRINMQWFS